jgi:hypothetical protein
MDKEGERVVAENVAYTQPVVAVYSRDIITTIISGVISGIVIAASFYLLNKFVFGSVLCRAGDEGACSSAPSYAMVVSMVIGMVIGLIMLVQARIYRPLLTVLAATIGLWSIHSLIGDIPWYYGLIVSGLLFGLAYLAFTWIGRMRSFIVSLVLTIILIVLVRLVFIS